MFRRFQRIAVVGMVVVLVGVSGAPSGLVGTNPLAPQIAAAAQNSPVGKWNVTAYCTFGWCKGQAFANPTVITAYSPTTGAYSGTDSGLQLVGQMHGSSINETVTGGSYISHVTGTISFSATKTTWGGTWQDSNHAGGHWSGTRAPIDVTISGIVTGQTCSVSSCSISGLAGQAILVLGTAQDGTAVRTSDSSSATGAWSVQVPAGTYTVGPTSDGSTIDGTGFAPENVHLAATADVANVNFLTCAASTTAASGAVHLASFGTAARARHAAAAGSTLTCPPDGVDWKMSLFSTADVPAQAGSDPLGMLPASYIYRPLVVHLFFTLHGKPFTTCSAKTAWKWTVTATSPGTKVLTKASGPLVGCSVNVLVSGSGTYHVVANEYKPGRTKPLHKKAVTGDVKPKDLLIVAMGDSNGSGEGYPPFYFDQCDRGIASYQYQAAQLLEQQAAQHASVTFVSASCSGARTQHLVNTPYAGIVAGQALPPQVDQLTTRLAPPNGGPRRKVDAAIISIGVNNIAFGPLLEYCVFYTLKKTASDLGRALQRAQSSAPIVLPPDPYPWKGCEDTPVSATSDGTGGVKAITLDTKSGKTLAQVINQLIAQLPARYNTVASGLAASGLVPANKVYITHYPSFWYSNTNTSCGGPPSSPFPQNTWDWLGSEGMKLNRAVTAAAAAHGWHAVTVPGYYFYGHGYCSFTASWFVPISKGAYYNHNGSFHPTTRGAHVTAVMVLHQLCPLLGDLKLCTSFPTP